MFYGRDDLGPPPASVRYTHRHYTDLQPWEPSFLGLLRGLSARHAAPPQVGRVPRPQAEPLYIRQVASLTFASREIAGLEQRADCLRIQLFGLGMLGPNGALPVRSTEIVRERIEAYHDNTTAASLDIFHHRSLTQFHQAWAGSRTVAGLDRRDEEVFSCYIGWLVGAEADETSGSAPPSHARLATSAHHVRESCSPDGIVAALSHFFGVSMQLQEFVLYWVAVDATECSHLARPGAVSVMGQDTLFGETVPDCQHKFRLIIGPLDLQQYLNFTPKGHDLPVLVEWVCSLVNLEFKWEVELQVQPHPAPPAVLGAGERLDWLT